MGRRTIWLCLLLAWTAWAKSSAELQGATATTVMVKGDAEPHFRVKPGRALTLKLNGSPTSLKLRVRVEGAPPAEPIAVEVQQDGEDISPHPLRFTAERNTRSGTGEPMAVSSAFSFPIKRGDHTIVLRWPAGVKADALVSIKGVQLGTSPDDDAVTPLKPLSPVPDRVEPAAPVVESAAIIKDPAPAVGASAPASTPAVASVVPVGAPGPGGGVGAAPATGPGSRLEGGAPPDPEPSRWTLVLTGGAQRSTEGFTSPASLGRLGLEGAYALTPEIPLLLGVDWGYSRQEYVTAQPALDRQGLLRAEVGEQRLEALLASGYELESLIAGHRLRAMPLLGVHWLGLRNEAFPSDLLGLEVGARVRFTLSRVLVLYGGVGWTRNLDLIKQPFPSAVGAPISHVAIQAGLSLPLGPRHAIDLGYQGDFLFFSYDARMGHGAALGLRSTF